jgi:hypothetical protein
MPNQWSPVMVLENSYWIVRDVLHAEEFSNSINTSDISTIFARYTTVDK